MPQRPVVFLCQHGHVIAGILATAFEDYLKLTRQEGNFEILRADMPGLSRRKAQALPHMKHLKERPSYDWRSGKRAVFVTVSQQMAGVEELVKNGFISKKDVLVVEFPGFMGHRTSDPLNSPEYVKGLRAWGGKTMSGLVREPRASRAIKAGLVALRRKIQFRKKPAVQKLKN
jgi:hypothetical protein